jgi:hypothetical protein
VDALTFDELAARLRETPRAKDAWSAFAAAALRSGRTTEAIAISARAYDADPTFVTALKTLLGLVSDEPTSQPAGAAMHESERLSISVVTCSTDDARFDAMAKSYASALAGWPRDIVRIDDAKSIAEGYTRGVAAARGEVIVFSHDDVEIIASDLGDRLVRRLADCDVLGVAGATRANGPAWSFAGWPFLHGLVIYPAAQGYRVTVYSRTAPLARSIRVMDGVLLAMRREIALRIGWDGQTCDGFHGYDVDFTLRASQAGLRLGVASDLGLVHRSYGSFEDDWEATARKLMAKHPQLNGEPGAETGPVARIVPSARHAMALVDNWARVGQSERA